MIVMSADMCHPPARTDSGGGGGESQGNPRRGGEYHFFLGRKLCSAFGQPAFFLAGNRLTTMAFGKEVTFGEGLEMFSFSVAKSTFYLAYIRCNPYIRCDPCQESKFCCGVCSFVCLHDRKTEHLKALSKRDHTSSIADHMKTTSHNIKWDHFDILTSGKTDFYCKIKETLLIQELQQSLNVNVSSEKLLLF